MEKFINNYCTCKTDNKSAHVLEFHVTDILTGTLRPVFNEKASMHPALSRRPRPKYASVADYDLHENQSWKDEYYVDLLIWIIKDISSEALEKNLHMLIPPVLIILDDYDVGYKEQGVNMTHIMVKKLSAKSIAKAGLDGLFLEPLFKCLNYLLEERDIPLLKATYPCIVDLIATKKDDKVRAGLYEDVLKGGVSNGFSISGHKIKFLPILLEPLPVLYEELGPIGVQYLKSIIPAVCDALKMNTGNNSNIKGINILAIKALTTIIKKCWPRIPHYKGIIMQSIAKSWACYFDKNDEVMCKSLKDLYLVFEAACQGQEKADKIALITFNPVVFNPLFA